MQREEAYVTSIPPEAKEKVCAKLADGSPQRLEYYLNREKVGVRHFSRAGTMELEYSLRNGGRHGWQYHWDSSGKLSSAEPYENGLPHGTAYQWASDGRLIGSYPLEHGTGIDLWRVKLDGDVTLSEVHYMQDGQAHGYEWWLDFDQTSVRKERHWQRGNQHGIEREWDVEGRLRRGYPRYWVQGEQVTKAKYLREAMKDPTLPPFRLEENLPQRQFPPEIAQHLRK